MLFIETKLKGAFIVDLIRMEDKRGFFGRSWCNQEFSEHGLNSRLVQCNISFNNKRGTIRGIHYQASPYQEAKLVRCTMGAIYDVIIDLRPNSPTFKNWFAMELTAENRRALYVPEGFGHGFQTLQDNTEVFYQMTEYFHPEAAQGIHWNDPTFSIAWPLEILVISDKDNSYTNWMQ